MEVLDGYGERAQRDDRQQGDRDRAPADEPGPADTVVDHVPVGLAARSVAADPAAERLRLEQPEDRGQQGERDEDRDQDGARSSETHRGEERDPDDGQRSQGDDHRETGEEDGRAGGADRDAHGLLAVVGVVQLRPVAGQDEQRVVDADREADHRGEHRRAGVDVRERGHRGDAGDAEGDAEHRGHDRQARGDEGAEGQEQDDERDGDADQLRGAARFGLHVGAGAVGLDGQPVVTGVVHGVEQRLMGGRLDVGDRLDVVLEADDADPAVGGQRAERGGVRLGGAGRRAALPGGLQHLLALRVGGVDGVGDRRAVGDLRQAAEVGDEGVDGPGVRRLLEGVPLGRGDDDVHARLVDGVARAREQLGLHVRGLLRRDAGDGERIGHRLGHGRGEGADGEHRDDPAGDEQRPSPVGGLAESVEQGGHGGGLLGKSGGGSGEQVACLADVVVEQFGQGPAVLFS